MKRRSAAHRRGKNREAEISDKEKGPQTADYQRSRGIKRRVQDAADGAPRGVLQQSLRGKIGGILVNGRASRGWKTRKC